MPNEFFIVEADLTNTSRLIRLWQFLARNENSQVTDREIDQIDVIACAERALEIGKTPIAMFRWLLADFARAKSLISNAQEDRAMRRLKEWKSQLSDEGNQR